jgi:hypothetical protein
VGLLVLCGVSTIDAAARVLRRWGLDLWYGDRSWKGGSGEGEMTEWLAEMGGLVVASVMNGHDGCNWGKAPDTLGRVVDLPLSVVGVALLGLSVC